MKIGEFSKKFNVSVATVRHYINLGLLVPEKNGFQYDFTDNDCREMEIIISMKATGFKLNELNKYLSILRFYNKDDYLLYGKLLDFFTAKRDRLYEERHQINQYIRLINKQIKKIELSSTRATVGTAPANADKSQSPLPGFPLNTVGLLRCPHCQSQPHLSHVDISGDSIVNGELTCSCGYHAVVKNGVMYTGDITDLENDPIFLTRYFGDENLITNEDGMLLMGMNDYSNEYLTNLYKDSLWIHKKLSVFDLRGKTILFPDIACQYLYSYYDSRQVEGSTFLVTALSERTIHTMRQHIVNANPQLKVAYIINQSGQLPLKRNCIDAVIDYLGSSNLGFFQTTHYFDAIAPYLTENALIAGAVEYYAKDSKSVKKIHELYAHAAPNAFTLDFAMAALDRSGFHIEKSEKINEGYDPGQFFEYHVPGDIRSNMVYLARRRRPKP
ncbi:MerR family transcriptional regulator [Anaerovorax odorimutans]|uniref:MerR family transcriptional regulator n=1 Tax=Anaerovorax odorimutans TaxID=109327 RepID=A0ABT1RQ34_9FIRM|nr:MerR family transcriptional regulator [Anaerovorax odorimutans]MCQ4637310.1 MerR family transcriptional regulator [Anaerovorax odorimutans]